MGTLAVGIFGVVSIVAYVIAGALDPRSRLIRKRFQELSGSHQTLGSTDPGDQARSRAGQLLHQVAPAWLKESRSSRRRLSRAGYYHPSAAGRFAVASTVLAMGGGLAATTAAMLLGFSWNMCLVLACSGLAAGILAPSLWLDRAVRRRQAMLSRTLPDLLDLMIVCLEGGLSLQATFRRVTEEFNLASSELAQELTIVQRDIDLGATIDQALKRFANRTEFEGAKSLHTFIREAQRFGTNITEALHSHADMLRLQREQSLEEKAQKAAVKMLLPTLLLILPAVFVVLVGPAAIEIQQAFGGK